MNRTNPDENLILCPKCGGKVTTTSRRSVNIVHPIPHLHVEQGECDSCQTPLQKGRDDRWHEIVTPVDERLDELVTSDVESRFKSKNGVEWVRFVERMSAGDELWTLSPSLPDYVLIAIVDRGIVKESKRFKR